MAALTGHARTLATAAIAIVAACQAGEWGEAPVPARSLADEQEPAFVLDEGRTASNAYQGRDFDPLPGLRVRRRVGVTAVEDPVRVGRFMIGRLGLFGAGGLDLVAPVHATNRRGRVGEFREGWPWAELSAVGQSGTRATVWIDPARAWVDAEVELVLTDVDGGAALESVADVGLVALSAPAWQRLGRWLLLDPGWSGTGRLGIRLAGSPRGEGDHVGPGGARLTHLIPVSAGSRPRFDVTVHVPDGYRVVAALPAAPVAAPAGWRAWRLQGAASALVAAVVPERDVTTRSLIRAGVRWNVIARDPGLADAVGAAADVLAPLAVPGRSEVTVVQDAAAIVPGGPRSPAGAAAGPEPLIVVPAAGGDAPLDRHAAAAAVAAWWLGATPDPTHQPCPWRDAAAAHLGTWVLDEAAIRSIRVDWAGLASSEAPFRLDSTGPVTDEVRAVHCARGALVWAALERRLGRDRTVALLRELTAIRWRPPTGGWNEVAARLDGDDAVWLRSWIDRPVPPSLEVAEVALAGGAVGGVVVQHRGLTLELGGTAFAVAPWTGRVTVAAMDGAREVGRTDVQVDGERTEFSIPDAGSFSHLVLDPDGWLALHVGDPHEPGRTSTVW